MQQVHGETYPGVEEFTLTTEANSTGTSESYAGNNSVFADKFSFSVNGIKSQYLSDFKHTNYFTGDNNDWFVCLKQPNNMLQKQLFFYPVFSGSVCVGFPSLRFKTFFPE